MTVARLELMHATGEAQLEYAAYAYAVPREHVTEDELAQILDAPQETARDVVRNLRELRLLRSVDPEGTRLCAVPPATAGAQLLMPAIRQLRESQREMGQSFARILAMMPAYESGVLSQLEQPAFQYLSDLATTRQVITELAARAKEEVLTVQPGGSRPPGSISEAHERTVRLLGRGVRMRTLYQHSARFDGTTVDYVRMVSELGAEVRIASGVVSRLLIFDREAALINLPGLPHGAVVVRECSVLEFMTEIFENTWNAAAEFPLQQQRAQVVDASEEFKQALLRLLVEGDDDKVIARKLGVSIRTCQRHLSEIMARLGARNRLHAGYLIHKHGLLDRSFREDEPVADGAGTS
ncbi:LuxR C-terminal-related transcriptional regulator [Streptomyces roseolus]|uniref:helix-turn-helix transcriptional regulator n=1 Tax=Streptomyces roseolus TaxID=67358 RepID=UPI0037028106